MLVSAKEMLEKAKAGHYAVGQFNINNLEWTKAILLTAQENNSPVILGVSEGAGKYMTGYKTVVGMVNGMLEELNITVPVALHLDHGSYDACYKCIEAGFSSVMFDGSHYPIEENVEKTIHESNIRVEENHIVYDSVVNNTREIEYNTLVIPAGYTYNVTLADGTRVTLNAGSRLKYPVEFIGDKREVELSGEAYFDVTKSGKPFEVSVSDSKIRVYGTQFNVKTSRENTVETVLVEGKIGFRAPGREEVKVVPGEQVSYNAASGNVDVRQVDTRYATAWMDGVFKYQDKKLNLVLEDISAWYGIEFELQTDITMIEVTMNLNKKTPIEEVISFIELMANCKFIKERGHYIVKK